MLGIFYHRYITHTQTRFVQASYLLHSYRYFNMTHGDITRTKLDLHVQACSYMY